MPVAPTEEPTPTPIVADLLDLLTPREVAHLAGVSPMTVTRWARTGRLPVAFNTPGGRRKFRRSDVERILLPVPAEQAS